MHTKRTNVVWTLAISTTTRPAHHGPWHGPTENNRGHYTEAFFPEGREDGKG